MKKFSNLVLVKEYPTMLMGKFPLRLYQSKEEQNSFYRYHFGFPEVIVKHLTPMLETTPYWGEKHWIEIEGFWLWFLTIMPKDNLEIPNKELDRELSWRLRSANKCLDLLRKWSKN